MLSDNWFYGIVNQIKKIDSIVDNYSEGEYHVLT